MCLYNNIVPSFIKLWSEAACWLWSFREEAWCHVWYFPMPSLVKLFCFLHPSCGCWSVLILFSLEQRHWAVFVMRLLTSVSLSKSTNYSTVCPMDTLDLDGFGPFHVNMETCFDCLVGQNQSIRRTNIEITHYVFMLLQILLFLN